MNLFFCDLYYIKDNSISSISQILDHIGYNRGSCASMALI